MFSYMFLAGTKFNFTQIVCYSCNYKNNDLIYVYLIRNLVYLSYIYSVNLFMLILTHMLLIVMVSGLFYITKS